MENTLYKRQNDIRILKCLVAQRRLYATAKTWSYAPKVVNLILVGLGFAGVCDGHAAWGWILAGIAIISWLISTLGEEYVKVLRGKAAKIQQYVDREIYREAFSDENLSLFSSVPLRSELDKEIAGITDDDIEEEKVRNWYSDYSSFPSEEAVFCCQRENLRWDLRLRIIAIFASVTLFSILGVSVMCNVWDLKVKDVLPVLIPAAGLASALLTVIFGLVLDCVRSAQMSAASAIIELGLGRGENMLSNLVDLQNLIYNNRCNVVFIPDCLYKCFRKLHQKREDAIARAHKELAAEPL